MPIGYESTADGYEIEQAGTKNGRAGGGEVEHAEGAVAGRGQGIADQQVGRGADLGHQPAEHGTERQGHEQTRGGGVGSAGKSDGGRHEDDGGGDVVDEGGHAAHDQYQQDGQDGDASSAVADDGRGERGGRSGFHQAGAEDEHGGDGDDGRAGEAGEGGGSVHGAGEPEDKENENTDAFGRESLGGEQHERADHTADNDPGFGRHRALLTAKRFTP